MHIQKFRRNRIHNIDINGLLSSLPPLFRFLGAIGFGAIADWIISSKYLSRTATRKLFVIISLALPGALLLGLGYVGCNKELSVFLLTVAFGCNGATSASTGSSPQDLAPNFAGTLYGICNSFGTVAGLLVPLVVGILTNNNQNAGQWQKVLAIGSGVFFVSCAVFLVWGKGEVQPWNNPPEEKDTKKSDSDSKTEASTTTF